MNAPQLSSFQDGHADQLFGNDLNHQRTTIEHESLQRRLQYPQNPQYQNQQQQMQQQQYYENQPQQQFEQNVQSIFGIGQSQPNDEVMGSNTINNMNNFYDGGYYGPFTAANTKDVNTSAFLTALCLNAVVFAVLLGSYELFRRWFPSVYSPKSSTDGGRRTSASLSGAPSPSRNKNAESTPAVNINTRLPLGWIPGVALFATGGSEAKGWYYLSMANLLQGSSKMWIPTAFIWLQTLYVLFVMNEEYKHYFDLIVHYMIISTGYFHERKHVVDDDSVLSDNRMPQRGEKVDSINYYNRELAVIDEKLLKMQHEKIELAQKGNDSGSPAQNDGLITGFDPRRRKPLLLTILDRLGIDFISGGIAYIQQNIDEVVDSVVGATMSSTGFITFRDLQTVTCAVKTPLFDKPDVLVVSMAPEPRDIIWENCHVNLGWSKGREWTANMLLGLGAILWSIPVAIIQALATADQIATVPGMAWISTLNGGAVAGFVNGYLPVVLLLTIIMVLPFLFYVVALHYEDRKTQSDVQKSIIGRYFYYQLANIYITVTAGSILESLGEIAEHPSNVFAILGKSLPNVVGYFATFIMTKVFAGLPLILLRVGPLFRMIFIKLLFREKYLTQSEMDEVYHPEKFSQLWYGWEYPNLLLVIVICFTYSCISPIILPVGAAYFLGAWIVYKNQILTVYRPSYESGGTMFPMACHRTLIGLVCGQLTLIGYCVMREGFYQALLMFPLPLISIKMMDVFKNLYVVPGTCISVERAVELDARSDAQLSFSADVYRQPVLTEKLTDPQILRQRQSATEMTLERTSTDSGKIV
ncbi:predicted protein [Thalassiosira pseudonana CCMP1335]|uniref:CSC1/OSCA1-like 7TM region domain-containing protein n=1 Tax=Thalassiosira pseudonana TaxID=35128 RepID=B8C4F1_THAPS|nr:predicted protein [Thalassiosira pseudonana CCMP1335]EED91711.1 predicted protein [Thalassiosira pseudonana CCMP1335]